MGLRARLAMSMEPATAQVRVLLAAAAASECCLLRAALVRFCARAAGEGLLSPLRAAAERLTHAMSTATSFLCLTLDRSMLRIALKRCTGCGGQIACTGHC